MTVADSQHAAFRPVFADDVTARRPTRYAVGGGAGFSESAARRQLVGRPRRGGRRLCDRGPRAPIRAAALAAATPLVACSSCWRGSLNPAGYEDQHALDLIEWNITVTEAWDYHATCRLKSVCKARHVAGFRQVITGSPGHTWRELRLRAWQSANKEDDIQIERVEPEHRRQKCFCLVHPTRLREGEECDYTYEFHWQDEPPDMTCFDAVNLYYYAHEVKEMRYSITLPYRAVSPSVEARGAGIDTGSIGLTRKKDGSNTTYSFQLKNPPRLVYVIRLPRSASPDA